MGPGDNNRNRASLSLSFLFRSVSPPLLHRFLDEWSFDELQWYTEFHSILLINSNL